MEVSIPDLKSISKRYT